MGSCLATLVYLYCTFIRPLLCGVESNVDQWRGAFLADNKGMLSNFDRVYFVHGFFHPFIQELMMKKHGYVI